MHASCFDGAHTAPWARSSTDSTRAAFVGLVGKGVGWGVRSDTSVFLVHLPAPVVAAPMIPNFESERESQVSYPTGQTLQDLEA